MYCAGMCVSAVTDQKQDHQCSGESSDQQLSLHVSTCSLCLSLYRMSLLKSSRSVWSITKSERLPHSTDYSRLLRVEKELQSDRQLVPPYHISSLIVDHDIENITSANDLYVQTCCGILPSTVTQASQTSTSCTSLE